MLLRSRTCRPSLTTLATRLFVPCSTPSVHVLCGGSCSCSSSRHGGDDALVSQHGRLTVAVSIERPPSREEENEDDEDEVDEDEVDNDEDAEETRVTSEREEELKDELKYDGKIKEAREEEEEEVVPKGNQPSGTGGRETPATAQIPPSFLSSSAPSRLRKRFRLAIHLDKEGMEGMEAVEERKGGSRRFPSATRSLGTAIIAAAAAAAAAAAETAQHTKKTEKTAKTLVLFFFSDTTEY